ncbi:hypothetical protein AURDEDRAFT_173770 [Auricularia subglabra TFB-10046 SS5]|nr:hypothetical protein AURDEDRAFT_173770 [Auricularia subglabra TFB-10046 SS5]
MVLEHRAVLDVLLDWLLSRAPPVTDTAVVVEPDCVVLAQSGSERPPRVQLVSKQLVLGFFASLALAVLLSRRPVLRRLSKRRARDVASSGLELLAAAWGWLLSRRLPFSQSEKTTRGIQTLDIPDQDTWLRRFTSTRPPSKETSVRLPPDWHDWFKLSPPKPSGVPLTPPRPITVLPLPRTPLTPKLLRATPTPLSPPPDNRRRVALRPKSRRGDRSESASGSSSEEAPSRAFAILKKSRQLYEEANAAPGSHIPGPAGPSKLAPPLPEPGVDDSMLAAPGPESEFDYELIKATLSDTEREHAAPLSDDDDDNAPMIRVTYPGGATVPSDDEDDFAPVTAGEGEEEPPKKKTRRSGRKWKRRIANNAAQAQADPSITWWNNKDGLNPCQQYEALRRICKNTYEAPVMYNKLPPDQCDSPIHDCCCNSVAFNLAMLCLNCQKGELSGREGDPGYDAPPGTYQAFLDACGTPTNRSLPRLTQRAVCNTGLDLPKFLYDVWWQDGSWFGVWTHDLGLHEKLAGAGVSGQCNDTASDTATNKTPDAATRSGSSSEQLPGDTTAIVGGVLGAAIILLLGLCAFLLLRVSSLKRKVRQLRHASLGVAPPLPPEERTVPYTLLSTAPSGSVDLGSAKKFKLKHFRYPPAHSPAPQPTPVAGQPAAGPPSSLPPDYVTNVYPRLPPLFEHDSRSGSAAGS